MRKGAVIVETRKSVDLVEVVERHKRFLPADWDILIFHSVDNQENARLVKGAITIRVGEVNNAEEYNMLLSSKWFWDIIPFDKILIFQHDSCLLREGIEEFLEWDYIGAPWAWNDEYAGNGGLSLRSKSTMLSIVQGFDRPHGLNEDHWICDVMYKNNIGKIAPIHVAKNFSVEAVFQFGTLGCHAIEKWLSLAEVEQILNQYK